MLRERLINRIKEAGFRFKDDAWRVTVFKKGPIRVVVQKRDILEDETACSILRQCGLSKTEIDEFMRNCRN